MMNRLPLVVLLLISLSSTTQAQQPKKTPPTTTTTTTQSPPAAPPSGIAAARFLTEQPDTGIENRLVALALNGPEYAASTHQAVINELDLKKTKQTWLNLLTLSSVYNDQSFKQPSVQPGQTAYVYPKYYFGITVPLGVIFSQGIQVKQARESLAYGKDQQEELARRIRADVLTKYKQYKYYAAQVEMQAELINDVLANSAQAEDNFRKGTITVETYIATRKSANDEIARNMNLKLQQDIIRLDIERMIGVPLDDVLRKAAASSPSNRK